MKIKFYQKQSGKNPVAEFLNDLPADEIARIAGCLKNVEELGFDSPRVQFRQIKGSLWEIKIKTSRSGYRIFYVCIKKAIIVLLHAYKKQAQKAPKQEIELAQKRMMEVYDNESTYLE
jgi:phage-related protein